MRLVSRRKLAKYAAEQLLAGNDAVLEEIAGFLIYEKHEREVELLARDIEVELAERGTVVATVESARALDAATKDEIKKLLASNSGVRASRRASGDARAAERPSTDASDSIPEPDDSSRLIAPFVVSSSGVALSTVATTVPRSANSTSISRANNSTSRSFFSCTKNPAISSSTASFPASSCSAAYLASFRLDTSRIYSASFSAVEINFASFLESIFSPKTLPVASATNSSVELCNSFFAFATS